MLNKYVFLRIQQNLALITVFILCSLLIVFSDINLDEKLQNGLSLNRIQNNDKTLLSNSLNQNSEIVKLRKFEDLQLLISFRQFCSTIKIYDTT